MRTKIRFTRRAALMLLVIAAAAVPQGSEATTAMAPLSVEELTRQSEAVVHGELGSMATVLEGTKVFTTFEVKVIEQLKGDPVGDTPTLKLYGGLYDGKRTLILGAPRLKQGEEVVLFLKANHAPGPRSYDVVNLAEGKFGVSRSGPVPKVERDLRGIHYIDSKAPPAFPETLEELKAAIRGSH